MRAGVGRDTPVALWALGLALLLLGPALGRGYVLAYDLVWVPDLALRPDFLGLASGLPRAVPSDAVVAVLDEVVPGELLQKLVLVGLLLGGGLGAARLVPDRLVARLVAVSVYEWNVLVAERLLIGHWPVLVAYAAAPWVLGAAREWRDRDRLPVRLLWLLPVGSLSAVAGLATGVVLLAFASSRDRLVRVLLLVAAANAPWVASGLLHAGSAVSDAAGAEVFALHGEGSVPAPLAALTLGGIWNAEVVPDSRAGALGWVALVALVGLAMLGLPGWLRRTPVRDRVAYAGCWSVGAGVALLSWAGPSVLGWVAAHLPGGGLLRDGSRLLVLCAPLLTCLVAEGALTVWRRAPHGWLPRASVAGALVLVPVAVLPDAAWGLTGALRPAHYPASYAEARGVVEQVTDRGGGDVLVLPLTSYRQPSWNHDRKVLDPVGRYLTPDYVASDVLVVSGTVLSGEDPRFAGAAEALSRPDPEARARALGDLGIGVVVVDPVAPGVAPEVAGEILVDSTDLVVIALPATSPPEAPVSWMVTMALAWAAFAGLLVAAVSLVVMRSLTSGRRAAGEQRPPGPRIAGY